MSTDLTTQAIRLALRMNQVEAEYASRNIAGASTPGARARHVEFGAAHALLEAAASGAGSPGLSASLEALATAPGEQAIDAGATSLDEEVADMSSAATRYQTLSESLNRHFGLMRLAVSGKS